MRVHSRHAACLPWGNFLTQNGARQLIPAERDARRVQAQQTSKHTARAAQAHRTREPRAVARYFRALAAPRGRSPTPLWAWRAWLGARWESSDGEWLRAWFVGVATRLVCECLLCVRRVKWWFRSPIGVRF